MATKQDNPHAARFAGLDIEPFVHKPKPAAVVVAVDLAKPGTDRTAISWNTSPLVPGADPLLAAAQLSPVDYAQLRNLMASQNQPQQQQLSAAAMQNNPYQQGLAGGAGGSPQDVRANVLYGMRPIYPELAARIMTEGIARAPTPEPRQPNIDAYAQRGRLEIDRAFEANESALRVWLKKQAAKAKR